VRRAQAEGISVSSRWGCRLRNASASLAVARSDRIRAEAGGPGAGEKKQTPADPGLARDCNPVLTALFTPRRPAIGRYEVCTAVQPIDEVMAAGGAEGFTYGNVEPLEALDAFGNAGSYDRFAVSRLYGGTRASVAHGWREAGSFESVTLVSPYPDASVSRLILGTMVIRLTIPR
jgi:hypothetical protein